MFTAMRAVMYLTGLCPYCFLAKRLLDQRDIPYEERRMRRSDRERLAARTSRFPRSSSADAS
jgi:glutaredoxin